MSEKKQNFLQGTALLAMATAIVKVIGAIYKIPLNAIIGKQGFSYYSTAYEIYNVLLMISTAGLPVAMSRMISQASSLGHNNRIRKIYAGFGDGCLEGVEVDGNDVDGVNTKFVELLHMFRVIAHCKKPCVNDGVKGFHSTVQAFGKICQFADTNDGKTCIRQSFCRTARGDNFKIASD